MLWHKFLCTQWEIFFRNIWWNLDQGRQLRPVVEKVRWSYYSHYSFFLGTPHLSYTRLHYISLCPAQPCYFYHQTAWSIKTSPPLPKWSFSKHCHLLLDYLVSLTLVSWSREFSMLSGAIKWISSFYWSWSPQSFYGHSSSREVLSTRHRLLLQLSNPSIPAHIAHWSRKTKSVNIGIFWSNLR